MSNNPYTSPSGFPENDLNAQSGVSPAIQSKVSAPALGLIIYGVIAALTGLVNVGYNVLALAGANPIVADQAKQMEELKNKAPADQAQVFEIMGKVQAYLNGPIGLVTNSINAILAIATIFAGVRMKKFQGHTGALVFSILACIPCTSSCCLIGLPIGIWSIIVLVNNDVKAAFGK